MPAVSPKVSLIIAGDGPEVGDVLASVLGQTYADFEVLIVHRAATERGSDVARPDDPRVRVIASESRGAASAHNVAIEQARGVYISALDAGDRLDPGYLARTTRILDENAAVSFVSCWEQSLGEGNSVTKPERCDLATLLSECTVASAALVRKTVLQAVGGYDDRMPREGYEAWDAWISVVARGFVGLIVPEVLIYRHPISVARSAMCRASQADAGVMQYLFEKHRESYQRHLLEVLLGLERAACDQLQVSYTLDAEVENRLTPMLHRRREELERLRQKLASRERAVELEAAVASMQGSWSWKLTAPLRAAYDALARFRRGGAGPRSGG